MTLVAQIHVLTFDQKMESFLLLRSKLGNMWELPQGNLKVGMETLEQCAERLFWEAVNVRCLAMGPVDVVSDLPEIKGKEHCIRFGYYTKIERFENLVLDRNRFEDYKVVAVADYYTNKLPGKITPEHDHSLRQVIYGGA